MKVLKTLTLLLMTSFMFSCEKTEDEVAPDASDKTLVGLWIISNTNFSGSDIPGDDSYLSFSDCDSSSCSGVDYKASNETSSTFTYTLNGEVSIDIVDNDTSKGGNYNGVWDIQEYTISKLVLKKATMFGDMIITFEK